MAKREFCLLAHNYDPLRHGVAGWLMSEKLDGQRAIWDGGLTRGLLASEVPWANVEKDGRYVVPPRATGLWTRYGNPIQAPDWWLDQLPDFPLDGELYVGRGSFQDLVSTTKTLIPGPGWRLVQYRVFDVPPISLLLGDGKIDNTNFRKQLSGAALWYTERRRTPAPTFSTFEESQRFLVREMAGRSVTCAHDQVELPFDSRAAAERVEDHLHAISSLGGEGLMLRRRTSAWRPERSWDLLKVKKLHDAEGTVVGYQWGKETDRGSKLLGKMGSLRVRMDSGVVFDLSGFTDEERVMTAWDDELSPEAVRTGDRRVVDKLDQMAREEGMRNPGLPVRDNFFNPQFKRGQRITFSYRELTRDGAPKEARYLRRA